MPLEVDFGVVFRCPVATILLFDLREGRPNNRDEGIFARPTEAEGEVQLPYSNRTEVARGIVSKRGEKIAQRAIFEASNGFRCHVSEVRILPGPLLEPISLSAL